MATRLLASLALLLLLLPFLDHASATSEETRINGFRKLHDAAAVTEDKQSVFSKYKLPFKPDVKYLGLLLDAGRHYFTISWIEQLLDFMYQLGFNLLHFRLTDDQAFHVKLESHPQLLFPTVYRNRQRLHYTPEDLRHIVKYAKARNISVVPEMNVPGHGGAWGGVPGLIVSCPKFICDKGYGVPLNVMNPSFMPILKDVLREVIDIFDNPPMLHLGGDEVFMSKPCFEEAGESMPDYEEFERDLNVTLKELGYPVERVIRWEVTGDGGRRAINGTNSRRNDGPLEDGRLRKGKTKTKNNSSPTKFSARTKVMKRAGAIEQFWETLPGAELRPDADGPFFVSTGLYFDTNGNAKGEYIFNNTRNIFAAAKKQSHPLEGIVVGAFELSEEFFKLRNVFGRMLAVAMAAGQQEWSVQAYMGNCISIGLPVGTCRLVGKTTKRSVTVYQYKWKKAHLVWKTGICQRLTYSNETRIIYLSDASLARKQNLGSYDYFWKRFAANGKVAKVEYDGNSDSLRTNNQITRPKSIPHAGIIINGAGIDLEGMVKMIGGSVLTTMDRLGLNLIQLRLVDEYAISTCLHSASHFRGRINDTSYTTRPELDLVITSAVKQATLSGIRIMPEISVSTNVGGWRSRGMLLQCPLTLCSNGRGMVHNLDDSALLPLLSNAIYNLRRLFTSEYIHLGPDERVQSQTCLAEANATHLNFDEFERKLSRLLDLQGLYDQDHILRWENNETTSYPHRTGRITQYRPTDTIRSKGGDGHPYFVTVNIFAGDLWTVFQAARVAATAHPKPLGVMAELPGKGSSNANRRLLAFAMGLGDEENVGKAEFEAEYAKLSDEMHFGDSSTSIRDESNVSKIDLKKKAENMCKATKMQIDRFMRDEPMNDVEISEQLV